MRTIWQDLRYGLRLLLKNPGFTVVAVLALTLGIGANTAIFSVVNSVLLRPLPYEESERLLFLSEHAPQLERMSVAYPNFTDWREQNQVFEKIGVFRRQNYNLTGGGEPERITAGMVSADLFAALRVSAATGRLFTNDEDKPGANPVVVLSHGFWQRRFGDDPKMIDQAITLDNKNYTVIGIMPPDFEFPNRAEMWVPVGPASDNPGWQNRGNHPGLYAIARLKPGVAIDQARSDMERVAINLEKQYPQSNTNNRVSITPLFEVAVGDIRPQLYVLLGAVGFVLLIACANVANLLLARATSRQKEIAIRIAVGAGRWRIIRQLLTESILVALVGGGLGLALAKWGVQLLIAISPNSIPRAAEIGLDVRVFAFTASLSILTGIIFGLVPAIQASRPDLNETLKDAGRGSTGRRHLLRSSLVVSEVALTVILVIGAGLMIRSFYRLQKVDPGFAPDRLLTFNISLPRNKYAENEQQINFFQELMQRMNNLPGVQSACMSTGLPLGNNGWQMGFTITGRPDPPPGQNPLTEVVVADSEYFHTMGITLLRGRNFTQQDTADGQRVAIIDEEFARRHWPDSDPLGAEIRAGGTPNIIVGVVRRVRMEGLSEDSDRVQSYYPFKQLPSNSMVIVLRTAGDPAVLANAVRREVLAIDKDQPIFGVQTMDEIWNDSIAPQQLNLMLLAVFAGVALVLAAVGIYGVMAYSVTQRTHEMGIRMALGARPFDVVKIVLQQGMALTVVGVLAGLGAAFALTSVMSSLLFGVSATDPLTFFLVAVLLTAVAGLACYIPARRATKVDPMMALRYE